MSPQLFVNEAQVTSSNLLSGEGVIHGLSAVLEINRNRCDEVTYLSVMVTAASPVQATPSLTC